MKLFTKRYHAPGTKPGTLEQTKPSYYTTTLLAYDEDTLIEKHDVEPSACHAYFNEQTTTWFHFQGQPTPDALRNLANAVDIHDLFLEDILNTGQRPKVEISESEIFVVLSLPVADVESCAAEQICIFVSGRVLISFCTGSINPFDLIYQRFHNASGRIRKHDVGYLFYSLIDTVIDHGYPVLDLLAERIQRTEDELLDKPHNGTLQAIHQLRRELLLLRRSLWPNRDVINHLQINDETTIINGETSRYLRDCYDHSITVIELLETYHEVVSGMMEIYLSSLSHRLNENMRVLTIIATLFIPPTFIVGLYGMNFDRQAGPLSMPELGWPFGYLMVWSVILVMVVTMLFYFRKKKWF